MWRKVKNLKDARLYASILKTGQPHYAGIVTGQFVLDEISDPSRGFHYWLYQEPRGIEIAFAYRFTHSKKLVSWHFGMRNGTWDEASILLRAKIDQDVQALGAVDFDSRPTPESQTDKIAAIERAFAGKISKVDRFAVGTSKASRKYQIRIPRKKP